MRCSWSIGCPRWARRVVAGYARAVGMDSWGTLLLTPTPTSTHARPAGSWRSSVRSPQTFAPAMRMSLGGLSVTCACEGVPARSCAMTSWQVAPKRVPSVALQCAKLGVPGACGAGRAMVIQRPPRGLCQGRPNWPTPPVWVVAMRRMGASNSPRASLRRSSRLVESISRTRWMITPGG